MGTKKGPPLMKKDPKLVFLERIAFEWLMSEWKPHKVKICLIDSMVAVVVVVATSSGIFLTLIVLILPLKTLNYAMSSLHWYKTCVVAINKTPMWQVEELVLQETDGRGCSHKGYGTQKINCDHFGGDLHGRSICSNFSNAMQMWALPLKTALGTWILWPLICL